jgi:CBS domain-containing protein
MGDFRIKAINSTEERNDFYRQIFTDLKVFEEMLNDGLIDSGENMIGAEQELTIIDEYGNPKPISVDFLSAIDDDHYTNELARFDLEINLDPVRLEGNCFNHYEHTLIALLQRGQEVADDFNASLFLIGILPTIVREHLDFEFMTPVERYKVLSNELLRLRGKKFEIFLQGVDDLNLKLDSILFEACNTSFQSHLQINPAKFKEKYNWAQMISGPVLSTCTNSPLLFGKELWSENRIALFKQSLDTRNFNSHYRQKLPRVYFGKDWLNGSAIELWKNDVARFPLIFRGEGEEDSEAQLRKGITPWLKAVRLHNGTTYTWNRLCYGVAENNAHIRLECRYMPAGPTVADEIANMAFWTGLMNAVPEDDNFWDRQDFRVSKDNFYKAARTGIHSVMEWNGKRYQSNRLADKILIPLAEQGLQNSGVSSEDINRYLGIMQQRVTSQNTGAEWQIRNFRALTRKFKPSLAGRILVLESLNRQQENIPVGEWEDISLSSLQIYFHNYFDELKVTDIMSTELYTLKDDVTVQLAKKVMEYCNFNHIILENEKYEFKGVLSKNELNGPDLNDDTLLKEIAIPLQNKVSTGMPVTEAQKLLTEDPERALIVMEHGKVVGIVTDKDL